MDVSTLSANYEVRAIQDADISEVYSLYKSNPVYFGYTHEEVSLATVDYDRTALPPQKEKKDKYYLGYFHQGSLVAVLDLIDGYPSPDTAFISFFITSSAWQGKGIGSEIISELVGRLKEQDFCYVRLGYVEENKPGRRFWLKNGFLPTGETRDTEKYRIHVMQRKL